MTDLSDNPSKKEVLEAFRDLPDHKQYVVLAKAAAKDEGVNLNVIEHNYCPNCSEEL